MPQKYGHLEYLVQRLNQTMDQHLKYQERMLACLLEIQNLEKESRDLIRAGRPHAQSEAKSDLHQALGEMSPGRIVPVPSTQETTTASRLRGRGLDGPYHLLTPHMAKVLLDRVDSLLHLKNTLPADEFSELQQLIRFAYGVGERKGS